MDEEQKHDEAQGGTQQAGLDAEQAGQGAGEDEHEASQAERDTKQAEAEAEYQARLAGYESDSDAEHEAELERRHGYVLPEGVPRFSIGALFMPPIWGPAHGQWAALFFYPVWVFADSMFRAAIFQRSTLAIVLGIIMFIGMVVITVGFAMVAPTPAYYRVKDRLTPEAYRKRERIWDICMVIMGLVFIVGATYYNLNIYQP